MKTKWACRSRYYDNGKTIAVVYEVDDTVEPSVYDTELYSEYVDVFDTYKEANKWKKDTLIS